MGLVAEEGSPIFLILRLKPETSVGMETFGALKYMVIELWVEVTGVEIEPVKVPWNKRVPEVLLPS